MAVREPRRGFTLVEVMAAMVILAVALLALQGMALAAVRTVGRADRESRHLSLANSRMEESLATLRDTRTLAGSTTLLGAPPYQDRLVVAARPTALAGATRWDVVVTLVPAERPHTRARDSVRVEASLVVP